MGINNNWVYLRWQKPGPPFFESLKGFAEWGDIHEIYKKEGGVWYDRINEKEFNSIDELVNEYIKSLNTQK